MLGPLTREEKRAIVDAPGLMINYTTRRSGPTVALTWEGKR